MNKCICFKDGFMSDGRTQFAIKGRIYECKGDRKDKNGIITDFKVKTENSNNCSHFMGLKFFNTYFKLKPKTLKEFIENGF